MAIRWFRSLGRHVAGKAIATQAQPGRILDLRLGMALIRDRRVPMRSKLMALALSVAAMTALVALEIPLEGFWAITLPALGVAMDVVADGAEETIGVLVMSALLLPHLTPRSLTETIRAERAANAPRQLS